MKAYFNEKQELFIQAITVEEKAALRFALTVGIENWTINNGVCPFISFKFVSRNAPNLPCICQIEDKSKKRKV